MPEFTIEVLVDREFGRTAAAAPLRRAVEAALAHQRTVPPCELSLVVTGDAALQELNMRHRGVDAPTDVLAFPNAPSGPFVDAPGQPRHLGDIIISFPTANAQAEQLGHDVMAELQLLAVHGVLHLLGHDDEAAEQRSSMWDAQREIIAALGVGVTLPD